MPKLSPDGGRIAATVFGATDTAAVYDVARGSSVRAKSDGNSTFISWDIGGRRLLIASDAQGGDVRHLYLTGDDGTGPPRPVLPDVVGDTARNIVKTPDGVGVIHVDESGLFLSRMDGDPRRERLTSFGEESPTRPEVSPDGRWLAYDIDVSGRREVYVRPFPTGNGTWQVSRGGGIDARWSPRGDELVYQGDAGDAAPWLMSVRLNATTAGLSFAAPKEIVKVPRGIEVWGFHPDGQRLLALRSVAPQYRGDRVVAVLNWFDQVRAKAPTR